MSNNVSWDSNGRESCHLTSTKVLSRTANAHTTKTKDRQTRGKIWKPTYLILVLCGSLVTCADQQVLRGSFDRNRPAAKLQLKNVWILVGETIVFFFVLELCWCLKFNFFLKTLIVLTRSWLKEFFSEWIKFNTDIYFRRNSDAEISLQTWFLPSTVTYFHFLKRNYPLSEKRIFSFVLSAFHLFSCVPTALRE